MKRLRMLRLPWRGRSVPHAILDVGRPCDIECPGCFNGRKAGFRPAVELEADLDALLGKRRLQTVSLTGGEPTLHPELTTIVRAISRRGLKAAILSHGQHLSPALLSDLRAAGLSVVLLHIQPPQRRRDIAADAPPGAWCALRAEKARLLHAHGIRAGLTWVAYRTRLGEFAAAVEEVLASPHLDFLLVTGYRDFTRFREVTGSVESGLCVGVHNRAGAGSSDDEVTLADLVPVVAELGLRPFAFVGSTRDRREPRWLTHLAAVSGARDGSALRVAIRPGGSDWFFTRLMRGLTGRYVFFYTPARWQFLAQLACNAVTGGRFVANLRVLARSLRGAPLLDKHILLQEGPTLLADGRIEYCEECPDAVWQAGALVPVCLADRMAPPGP